MYLKSTHILSAFLMAESVSFDHASRKIFDNEIRLHDKINIR